MNFMFIEHKVEEEVKNDVNYLKLDEWLYAVYTSHRPTILIEVMQENI